MRAKLFISILPLIFSTYASAADTAVSCTKVAECAQQLVTLVNRLSEENRLLADRVKSLETIRQGVVAFDANTCPIGWEPYRLAENRFIRGLEPGGSPGRVQEDAFQGHTFGDGQGRMLRFHPIMHSTAASDGYSDLYDTGIYGSNPTYVARGGNVPLQGALIVTDGSSGAPRVSDETRPKNVALLYCRKQ